MAGKLTDMSKIKQLLLLKKQGKSNREAAKLLGLYKGTVNRYLKFIDESNLNTEELLLLDDPVLEAKFSPGKAAYLDSRFEDFQRELDSIIKELEEAHKTHVTRELLWKDYIEKYPDGYKYTQFCHHINQHRKVIKPRTVLVGTYRPADMLFIDFAGDTMHYYDRSTGEEHTMYTFVATLPYSDHAFAMCVRNQTTEEFTYALTCCFEAFGGVPSLIIPDNLKTAVIKADRYEPTLNKILEDMGNHYGFFLKPARVCSPQDKALVESSINRIYHNVYAPLRKAIHLSVQELNDAVKVKILQYNQTRMQQKPYSRQEHFLADEKCLLKPLPEQKFEIKYYCDLIVGTNCHIYLSRDKHYYSVHYSYISKRVNVIYTRSIVRIYCDGILLEVYQRAMGFGYSTKKSNLASNSNAYLSRSPEYYITKADKHSETMGKIVRDVFMKAQHPELAYRQCEGIMSLSSKVDRELMIKACQTALNNGITSYKFIGNFIKNNRAYAEEINDNNYEISNHENIRGQEYYK